MLFLSSLSYRSCARKIESATEVATETTADASDAGESSSELLSRADDGGDGGGVEEAGVVEHV